MSGLMCMDHLDPVGLLGSLPNLDPSVYIVMMFSLRRRAWWSSLCRCGCKRLSSSGVLSGFGAQGSGCRVKYISSNMFANVSSPEICLPLGLTICPRFSLALIS